MKTTILKLKSVFIFGPALIMPPLGFTQRFDGSTNRTPERYFPMWSPQLMRLVVLFSLIILVISSAIAQNPQRVLRGRVLDPNRAAIPGASVSVNAPGLPSSTTTTNQHGEYSFTLPPGNYQITATAEGFADVTESVQLGGTAAERDLLLQVFASGAFVTITDTAGYAIPAVTSATKTPTLLRDKPQSVSVVTQEQIRDQ